MQFNSKVSFTMRFAALVTSIAGITSGAHGAVVYSDDFTSNSLATYSLPGGSLVTYGATGGVGGGGGLLIGQGSNDSTSFIPGNPNNTPFAIGSGNAVTISMMLKLNTAGFGGGTSKAFLGLASGANTAWGQNPTLTVIGGAMQNAVQIGTRSGTNGGAASNGNMQPSVTLSGGNWYLYSVTLQQPTTGTNWTASSFLEDYGSDGLTAGLVAASFTGLTVPLAGDTSISQATSAFLNFGVRNQSFSAVDNFVASVSVVPEPTSAVVAAALSATAAVRRRRVTC